MAVKFRNYGKEKGFSEDYMKVWNFLNSLPHNDVHPLNYSDVRWEWCRVLSFFDKESQYRTGIWEDDEAIVGMVTYETQLGEVFLNLKEGYEQLLEEMFDYATTLRKDGKVKICIPDTERELQMIAAGKGFVASQDRETDSILDIESTDLSYTLPEGYSITTMEETYDLEQYATVMWYGFNHGSEGPVPLTEKDLENRAYSISGPHCDKSLKIAVMNPEGKFVSYAGFWYNENQDYCTIEPCATHEDYRRMGLGKAAIYEGIKRCAQRGAKRCVVGSSQQFYFRIGFAPYHIRTYWTEK